MFQGDTKITNDGGNVTVAHVLAAAREDAKLTDFGDEELLEPLAKLIECAAAEIRFSEAGFVNFKAMIQRFLVNRLRFVRDVKANPEILEEDVSDPIIILGMPRTGTTKLQRLLSAAPEMQKLSLWKLLNPAPFDNEGRFGKEERLAFAKLVEDATRANPEFTTSHETAADEADEDAHLAIMSFDYSPLYFVFPSPSYLEWTRKRPQKAAHNFVKKMLQYLQWQDGGRRGRRWVLKNPGSLGFLRALHETFPKALFIHSHRDMSEVVPSYCRLIEGMYQTLLEPIELHEHGRNALTYWGPEMARYHQERSALGDAIDMIDVPYLEIVRDPMAVIHEIYRRAQTPFSKNAETAMQVWSDANKQHKHGKATYSLERYGLTRELIAERFPKDVN